MTHYSRSIILAPFVISHHTTGCQSFAVCQATRQRTLYTRQTPHGIERPAKHLFAVSRFIGTRQKVCHGWNRHSANIFAKYKKTKKIRQPHLSAAATPTGRPPPPPPACHRCCPATLLVAEPSGSAPFRSASARPHRPLVQIPSNSPACHGGGPPLARAIVAAVSPAAETMFLAAAARPRVPTSWPGTCAPGGERLGPLAARVGDTRHGQVGRVADGARATRHGASAMDPGQRTEEPDAGAGAAALLAVATAPRPATPPHQSIYSGEGWAEGGGEELQQGGGGRGSGREVAGEELSPTWGLTPPLPPTSPSSRRRLREKERGSFDLGERGDGPAPDIWTNGRALF